MPRAIAIAGSGANITWVLRASRDGVPPFYEKVGFVRSEVAIGASAALAMTALQGAGMAGEYYFEEGCYITELANSSDDPELSIARARVLPGITTRWHRLRNMTERYLLLEGRGSVEVGEEPAREVGPGDVVRIPPMCRQRITNVGKTDLIFLAICSPRFRRENYENA